MFEIRAFRAIDEPETCQKFIDGHLRVLSSIGVTKVTSSTEDWMFNPAAFVLVVENLDDGEILGGSRIHAADGTTPLPIETATCKMDPKVADLVKNLSKNGVGEICGLWNSRKVAGMGIGSIYLNRASIAVSAQLGLENLIALCAPYTVKPALTYGYAIEKGVGNEGTFYYPKLDLVATVMSLIDTVNLPNATELERGKVMELRNKWVCERQESEAIKPVTLKYNLLVKNIKEREFHLNTNLIEK